MSVAMTDEQRAMRESVEGWAQRADVIAQVRRLEVDRNADVDSWAGLANLGVLAAGLPEDLGGAGGDLLDTAAVLEAAAGRLVPGPILTVALAAHLLVRHAPQDLAKSLIADLVTGDMTAAVALQPGDLVAEPSEDGSYLVHGEAPGVLGATPGALLVLTARLATSPTATAPGEIWFVVPGPDPAVGVDSTVPLDFSRPVATVRADSLRIPAERVLVDLTGEIARDLAAVLVAAETSGLVARCLQVAVDHVKVREQFGRPIGSFQAVKHLCAQLLCRREEVAALAWDAARAADDAPDQLGPAAAAAAASLLDAGVEAAFGCIQLLGGTGFTWEHDAHLYLRRALAGRQWLGGSGPWKHRAATLALAGRRRVLTVETSDSDSNAESGEDAADLRFRHDVRLVAQQCAALPDAERRDLLASSGLMMPHWPAPYGRAASVREQVIIDEELSAAGVDRPDLVIGSWAGATVLEHGTDEQRRRFVADTISGRLTWCQLFSEPEAGSDLASLRTRAERVDGGWRLTGQKVWTSLATQADRAICLARTDASVAKHRGISYFLLDMTSPGITIRPLREITGDAVFNEVFLDDVFVPDDDLLGEPGDGWRMTRTTLAAERVAMARGSTLGEALEAVLTGCAADPATAQRLGAERLGSLVSQASSVSLIAARIMERQLASGRVSGGAGDTAAMSAVMKLVGVRLRQDVAEAGYEALGPEAIALEGPAGAAAYALLQSRCLSIAGGTTQILLTVAAERILGLPREKSL